MLFAAAVALPVVGLHQGLAGEELVAARFDALKIGLNIGAGSGRMGSGHWNLDIGAYFAGTCNCRVHRTSGQLRRLLGGSSQGQVC